MSREDVLDGAPADGWPDFESVEEAHEWGGRRGRAYRTSRGTYHPATGLIDVRWPLELHGGRDADRPQ